MLIGQGQQFSCKQRICSKPNPLASRHQPVPVAPIPCSVYGPQAAKGSVLGLGGDDTDDDDDDESEALNKSFQIPGRTAI